MKGAGHRQGVGWAAGGAAVMMLAGIPAPAAPAAATSAIRIVQTTAPVFPVSGEAGGARAGEVHFVINVDAGGNLADFLVAGYTHADFVAAASAALREWRYEPARVRGEPVGSRAEIAFHYEVRGRVASLLAIDSMSNFLEQAFGGRMTDRIVAPGELDFPVALVSAPQPFHPGRLLDGDGAAGSVVLDFYIDETGRPRMPVVIGADHTLFAQSAVNALAQWRFTPPTRHGRPVCVRATQRFMFRDDS
jgi:TonB family protein